MSPRATDPSEAEVCIRESADANGQRGEIWATSFIIIWHDQFGTRNMIAQNTESDDNPGSNLLDALSFAVARQLIDHAEHDDE